MLWSSNWVVVFLGSSSYTATLYSILCSVINENVFISNFCAVPPGTALANDAIMPGAARWSDPGRGVRHRSQSHRVLLERDGSTRPQEWSRLSAYCPCKLLLYLYGMMLLPRFVLGKAARWETSVFQGIGFIWRVIGRRWSFQTWKLLNFFDHTWLSFLIPFDDSTFKWDAGVGTWFEQAAASGAQPAAVLEGFRTGRTVDPIGPVVTWEASRPHDLHADAFPAERTEAGATAA